MHIPYKNLSIISILMPERGSAIAYELRCVIITYRCLFRCSFSEIESKIGVSKVAVKAIYRRISLRVGNENFHKFFAYCDDVDE